MGKLCKTLYKFLLAILSVFITGTGFCNFNCYSEKSSKEMNLDLSDNGNMQSFKGCKKGHYKINLVNLDINSSYSYKISKVFLSSGKLEKSLGNSVPFGTVSSKDNSIINKLKTKIKKSKKTYSNLSNQLLRIENANDDKDGKNIVMNAYSLMSVDPQLNPAEQREINRFLNILEQEPDEITFFLNYNEQVSIEVIKSKDGKKDIKWELELISDPKGTWVSSWSIAILPNQNDKYFTRLNDLGKYTIIEKPDNNDLTIIPAMFYTYAKTSKRFVDWEFGWSLGLGLDSENLTPFAGYNGTYNKNIGVTIGVAINKRSVLLGEYRDILGIDDRGLAESIDNLTEEVYKASPFIALSYRFK